MGSGRKHFYDGYYIIIEKNPAVSEAIEHIKDENVSNKIIEYNRYLLKGKRTKKRSILNEISNYVEPILKDRTFPDTTLQSDAGFLINNFHIRHNNLEGPKKQDYTASLNPKQLEEWYDKTYTTLLMLIIANEQRHIQNELKELRKYNWKT